MIVLQAPLITGSGRLLANGGGGASGAGTGGGSAGAHPNPAEPSSPALGGTAGARGGDGFAGSSNATFGQASVFAFGGGGGGGGYIRSNVLLGTMTVTSPAVDVIL